MSDINKTLSDRGKKYGLFSQQAKLTQEMMKLVNFYDQIKDNDFEKLSDVQREGVHMILHKISRMVCGDPNYLDNIHDVIGYAKLIENEINLDNFAKKEKLKK